ncbi:LytR/AlgR family response regulator transcription factor [Pseudomaricurvus sp.]|uniref:LytR/AlgR family response regulator transcription factor n=1 Tax=Pseudomaricurvus sp. TaxID=2004510 RepID=UPI003F6BC4C1
MDIIIVDDEPLARDRLQRMLSDEANYCVVAQAANADEAMEAVYRLDPDLVLLDIHMPGESGLQAAKQLTALDDPPAVIFCTAYDQHALDAFAVNAQDYLLKPVRKDKLMDALSKAQRLNRMQRQNMAASPQSGERTNSGRAHISTRTRRGVELIAVEKVFFFAADQKYVTVYHQGGETLIDDTLKELEQEFGDRFVRIHRNALVPLARVEAMEKNSAGQFELRLKGTDLRPAVSRRHAGHLRDLLSSL